MKDDEVFIVVTWPESQDYIGLHNCHLINDDEGFMKYGSSAYFVRKDVYERVTMNKQMDEDIKRDFQLK